ncbi:MAG: PRC-barrel domain-containing protein [Actinobacteria bacterium]|nr:PRC-barrel domain-containing protein [Actinomycetota bacterium]
MTRIGNELIGLPIVSLHDAEIVGEIDALIIDDATLTVVGFLVDLGFYEAKVLPFAAARAIGRDAVIVERPDDVTLVSHHPDVARLADKDIAVAGATAVTSSGHTVGTIGELLVDVDTGRIIEVELVVDPGSLWPSQPVLLPIALRGEGRPAGDDAATALSPMPGSATVPGATSSAPHYLLGKRVVRRIESPLGVVVADAGDIVTEETIRRAEGGEVLLILSLNVE